MSKKTNTLSAVAKLRMRFAGKYMQTKSVIPPVNHHADGQVGGKNRTQMTPTRLKHNHYTRRWIVESFMSAVKRTMGTTLQAHKTAIRVLGYAIRR